VAAGLDAQHHRFVIGDPSAIVGAHFTDARADAAGHLMQRGVAQHEVGAGDADLHAVLKQPDMPGFGVLAALSRQCAMVERQTE
jgi:hypothetical protein